MTFRTPYDLPHTRYTHLIGFRFPDDIYEIEKELSLFFYESLWRAKAIFSQKREFFHYAVWLVFIGVDSTYISYK